MTSDLAAFFCAASVAHFFIERMSQMENQYFEIFGKITDIIEQLKQLQADMEEMYICAEESKTAQC